MKYRKMFEPFNEAAVRQVANKHPLDLSEVSFTVSLILILAMVLYVFLTRVI